MRFSVLENVLHGPAKIGEVPVAEPMHHDVGAAGGGEERLGARTRLALTVALRAEDDPGDLDVGQRPRRGEERRAAADLEVVRVRADGENPTDGLLGAREREAEHYGWPLPTASPPLRQGAWPLFASASRRCLSLIVSIGSQKPS